MFAKFERCELQLKKRWLILSWWGPGTELFMLQPHGGAPGTGKGTGWPL